MAIHRAVRTTTAVATLVSLFALPTAAKAASPRRALREAPGLVRLPDLGRTYRNAADALTELSARSVPVPSTSSAFTYRLNPQTGEYERSSETFGPPPFMERAHTLGHKAWSISLTGQYLELDELDGDDVGQDPDPIIVGGQPVGFSATPKILYHVATVTMTYGLLDNLDLSLIIPLAAIDYDTNARRQEVGSATVFVNTEHAGVKPIGIGDLQLRAKYQLWHSGGLTASAGVWFRLPSGEDENALGTGDFEVGPHFAVSQLLGDMVELHGNVGIDVNTIDTNQSSASYAAGVNIQPIDWLNLGVAFLGRSEFDDFRAASSISGPHQTDNGPASAPYLGLDLERNDMFDLSAGAGFRLYKTLVLTGGLMYALNNDGLRMSDVSPIVSIEATF